MNKELARDIINLLGTPAHIEVISDFADTLIEKAKDNLTLASDIDQVKYFQGQIATAKEFKKIREYAVNIQNQGK